MSDHQIHFDEKRGSLELDCEAEYFARYREIAREQLAGVPEITLDKITEIHVTDADTLAAQRRERPLLDILLVGLFIVTLLLAAVGAVSIVFLFLG